MEELRGNFGIGHCRYPTAGSQSCAEAQPLYTNSPYGLCVAHNGNITNVEELKQQLSESFRHINTNSDSELLLNLFAEELQRRARSKLRPSQIFEAAAEVMAACRGGYAVVIVINGVGLFAFRDPHGIRPAVFGTRESIDAVDQKGNPLMDFCVASESVALDTLGFNLIGDVEPGEALFFDSRSNTLHRRQCAESHTLSPCIFEYVYFARPDSVMNGVGVYESRLRMGEYLARRILHLHPEPDIDVVIPIPDTSRSSALQCAEFLQRPFREGFIKNRYIARTFIMPGQAKRKKTVRLKLNTIRGEFKGKAVLLVDDSVVRGTTATQIILMAREAGARKVYLCSAAPAVRHPNVYGVDIPTRNELVAHGRTERDVARIIGADWLVYQTIEDLEQSVWDAAAGVPDEPASMAEAKARIPRFDSSCFSGEYVTSDVNEEYLERLAAGRNDAVRFGGNEFPMDHSKAHTNGHSVSAPSKENGHAEILSKAIFERRLSISSTPPASPSPALDPKSPHAPVPKRSNSDADSLCEGIQNKVGRASPMIANNAELGL
eukprot:scaffold109_cov252-Pinguiococcus_pyrenoidosus.AAC.3